MDNLLREDDICMRGPYYPRSTIVSCCALDLSSSDKRSQCFCNTTSLGPLRPSVAALGGMFARPPVVRRSSNFPDKCLQGGGVAS